MHGPRYWIKQSTTGGGPDNVVGTPRDDNIQGVTVHMSRLRYMLLKSKRFQKIQELDCVSIIDIVNVDIHVPNN